MREEFPKVSVIIPIYNAEPHIKDCLTHICDQNFPKQCYEVIAVDNASTDNSAKIIKTFNVIYHYSAQKGPSPSRNQGIKIATGEYILFIDSDCIADKNLILNHIKKHLYFKKNDPQTKVIGGGVGGINKNFWATCDDFCSWYLNNPRLKPRYEAKYLPTANLSVSKRIADELYGFDEKLTFGEDVNFCMRIRKKNYKIYFEPSAKVLHINRTSFRSFIYHAKQWATTETTPEKSHALTKNKLITGFTFLYYCTYKFFELMYVCIVARRFTIFIFLPFILLNKIVFGYYKIKKNKK